MSATAATQMQQQQQQLLPAMVDIHSPSSSPTYYSPQRRSKAAAAAAEAEVETDDFYYVDRRQRPSTWSALHHSAQLSQSHIVPSASRPHHIQPSNRLEPLRSKLIAAVKSGTYTKLLTTSIHNDACREDESELEPSITIAPQPSLCSPRRRSVLPAIPHHRSASPPDLLVSGELDTVSRRWRSGSLGRSLSMAVAAAAAFHVDNGRTNNNGRAGKRHPKHTLRRQNVAAAAAAANDDDDANRIMNGLTPIERFRKFAKFVLLLIRVWMEHVARVRVYTDMSISSSGIRTDDEELMFDKNKYKSGEQTRVLPRMRLILLKDPFTRTNEDNNYVTVALSNYKAFTSFPTKMKQFIASSGWYESHPSRKMIIKEDHSARCVYYVLSGEVVVSKLNEATGQSETRCFLSTNDIFGEVAIVNNCTRTASIITKRPTELLVFSEQDYINIFMYGGLKNAQETFLRKLSFLDGWPVDILEENKTMASIKYFRKNAVLIHNSKFSDWVVIIKSGTCSVLKKLEATCVNHLEHTETVAKLSHGRSENRITSDVSVDLENSAKPDGEMLRRMRSAAVRRKRRLLYIRRELENLQLGFKLQKVIRRSLPCLPKNQEVTLLTFESKQTTNNDDFTSSAFINTSKACIPEIKPKQPSLLPDVIEWPEKLRYTDMLNTRYFSQPRPITEADRNPQFIEVQLLQRNDVFGLADLVHDDQPALSLISNGAQCVLIHKRLYVDHAPRALLARLSSQVRAFPSDAELQENLQVYADWLSIKDQIVRQSIENSSCHRIKNKARRLEVIDADVIVAQPTVTMATEKSLMVD